MNIFHVMMKCTESRAHKLVVVLAHDKKEAENLAVQEWWSYDVVSVVDHGTVGSVRVVIAVNL